MTALVMSINAILCAACLLDGRYGLAVATGVVAAAGFWFI